MDGAGRWIEIFKMELLGRILSAGEHPPRRSSRKMGISVEKSPFPADVAFTHRPCAWVTNQLATKTGGWQGNMSTSLSASLGPVPSSKNTAGLSVKYNPRPIYSGGDLR